MEQLNRFEDIHLGFKKIDGTKIDDLENYIYSILASDKAKLADDKFKISIGTDSVFAPAKKGWSAVYISTIAFTYGNTGTHLILKKDIIKGDWSKERLDLYSRLWREVEMCAALATWMKETTNIEPEVHLDINPNKQYQSNKLFNAAEGYIKSLGFNVQLKPDAAIASCASDYYLNS